MSTTFQTFRVGLDPEGEDRFIPFDPKSYGAPITENTIDGDFDFPIDFEYTTSGAFYAYSYIPDYMRATSSGREQYYFLTPISVADPKYVDGTARVRPLKFAAHKDVCATFHTEYLKYQTGSRIYQGHYLGAQSYDTFLPPEAPDWTQTPRLMPYHLSETNNVYRLFKSGEYTVLVFFTQENGIKNCLVTLDQIVNLWGSADRSVGDFIFGLKDINTFGTFSVASVDGVKVVPRQALKYSTWFNSITAGNTIEIAVTGNSYSCAVTASAFIGSSTIFHSRDVDADITLPTTGDVAFEVGAGSSWVQVLPFVHAANAVSIGIDIILHLFFGAGGTFQLVMDVEQDNFIRSVDLSQYCDVNFYWLNAGDKSQQTTAAVLQTISGVLGTTASVAMAVPTGGASLIGAASGIAGTAGGVVGLVDSIQKPPPTTSGAGSFPGAFVTTSPFDRSMVYGFPMVKVYTIPYSDTVAQTMRGAYAENTDGEPFYLSLHEQRELFYQGPGTTRPYYMYIRADAIPLRTRANEELGDNDTALMTRADMNEFRELLRRGLRLWFNHEKYIPGYLRPFRSRYDGTEWID